LRLVRIDAGFLLFTAKVFRVMGFLPHNISNSRPIKIIQLGNSIMLFLLSEGRGVSIDLNSAAKYFKLYMHNSHLAFVFLNRMPRLRLAMQQKQ
jgi:hypothetical protein